MANSEEKKEEGLTKKELKEQAKLEKQKQKEKQQKANAKKEKKPGLFKKIKDSWSELKKVTWPTFGSVVKKTGVVILVVLLFTAVLFGIEYGLGSLYNLLLGWCEVDCGRRIGSKMVCFAHIFGIWTSSKRQSWSCCEKI